VIEMSRRVIALTVLLLTVSLPTAACGDDGYAALLDGYRETSDPAVIEIVADVDQGDPIVKSVAEETSTEIRVVVRARRTSDNRAAVGEKRTINLTLARPLGERRVINEVGKPVPRLN
jgi:hypothetical protein